MGETQDHECVKSTRETTTVEVHGPGGLWAKLGGADIKSLFVVIIILMAAATLWLQSDANSKQIAENTKMFLNQHAITQGLQKDIIKSMADGQDRSERAQVVLTYVLTLNEAERKSLRLAMPDELRYGARSK